MTDAEALSRRIAGTTALAWVVGVVLLAGLAIGVFHRAQDRGLESQLRAHVLAAYGLGFWDEDGVFQDALLHKEAELLSGPVALSFVGPEGLVFGPGEPGQDAWLAQALDSLEPIVETGADRWVLVLPTYDDTDRPCGIVIGAIGTGAARQATRGFAAVTVAGALALIGAGLVLSRRQSRRVLGALAAAMAERERILAGAAHELRTPLATVLAVSEGAQEGEHAAALAQIRETTTGAAAMVDRLLTWSRLAEAELVPEPVRLDLLVETCLAEDDPLVAQACVVQADPRLVEVAVRNLVENARVHGGGLREVRVAAGRITVLDHGPGLAGEHLLAPFAKGEGSRGTGLGLALVARIAEKHGGRLEVSPAVALVIPVAPGG